MVNKFSRAQRRHDYLRLKEKRQYYWGYGRIDEWNGIEPAPSGEINYMSAKNAGRVTNTPKPLSCFCCGNPRHICGGNERLTLQERKENEKFIYELKEFKG